MAAPTEMHVALYASPWRSIQKPTGVGQHLLRMSCEVARAPGVRTSLLATRDDYTAARQYLPPPLDAAPVRFLPGAERMTRMLMMGTNWLPVERWSGHVDWVYCPKEQPVATKQARLAVTVHDVLGLEEPIAGLPLHASSWSRARWRLLIRRILQRAQLIPIVSDFTRQRLIELFSLGDDERLVVVGNGVSDSYFREPSDDDSQVLEKYGVADRPFLCLVGSLTFRKGGDLILSLARRLMEERRPHRIVVSGRRHDAELQARFAAMKSEYPQLPLDLPGYVSEEEQAVLLSHSVALLFPSRYEGFGIPVLEAMAAGAPVICSRNAALPEVAGDAALFLESESVDEMLHSVQHIEDSQNGRAALISSGRRRAAEFTWQACAAKLLAAMRARC